MKFEFSLPRNTKLKSLNMVINSNDRQHQTDKAKVTKRIRAFAYWHTSMNKDKGRAALAPLTLVRLQLQFTALLSLN